MKQLEALSEFGHALGLAFQIEDDILDIIGDEQKLGKPVKSDEKQMKVTFPYFIGMEASEQKVRELTGQAKAALQRSTIANPERLLQIADYLMKKDY